MFSLFQSTGFGFTDQTLSTIFSVSFYYQKGNFPYIDRTYHSKSQPRSQVQSGSNEHPQRQAGTSSNVRPKLRISLTKWPDGGWSPSVNSSQNRHGPISTSVPVIVNNEIHQPLAATVAENVTSFLSGIRATFRNDNTIVVSKHKSKKPSQSPSNDWVNKHFKNWHMESVPWPRKQKRHCYTMPTCLEH